MTRQELTDPMASVIARIDGRMLDQALPLYPPPQGAIEFMKN